MMLSLIENSLQMVDFCFFTERATLYRLSMKSPRKIIPLFDADHCLPNIFRNEINSNPDIRISSEDGSVTSTSILLSEVIVK